MSWGFSQSSGTAGYNPTSGTYGAPTAGYGGPPPSGTMPYGAPPSSQPPYSHGYGAPPNQAPPYGGPSIGAGYGTPVGYGHQGTPQYGGYGAPLPAQAPPPGVSPELWQWFQAVDADRSGKITAEELRLALLNGNCTPFNQETCRLMIGMFDSNKDGTIDVREFAALWKYIQDWKSCFDSFDSDRSGNINSNELNGAFRTFGYNLSANFSNLCIRVFDRQKRNCINFDDFIQCCVMLKSLTDKFREKDVQQRGEIRIYYEEFLKMVLDNTPM